MSHAASSNAPRLFPFLIRVGQRGAPRLEYSAMCASSFDAWQLGAKDAQPDERIDVIPIGERESFPVKAARLAMEVAMVRECLAC